MMHSEAGQIIHIQKHTFTQNHELSQDTNVFPELTGFLVQIILQMIYK